MFTTPTVALLLSPPHAARVRAALAHERVVLADGLPADVAVLWGGPDLATRVERARYAGARQVVAVLEATDATTVRRSLEDGVDAAIPEVSLEMALPVALRGVVAGLTVVPRSSRNRLSPPALSHRERQVLALLVEGRTNAEIGERLYLAESTIKSHVSSAFAKLGVRSRRDAIAMLLDTGSGLGASVLGVAGADGVRRFEVRASSRP